MTYDYETDHIGWQISEAANGVVDLYRFIPGDNPPFGGWLEFVSDHYSCAQAESRADETEWSEYPLESDIAEPVPLIGTPPLQPLKKVA
jgi:hypothetical protein